LPPVSSDVLEVQRARKALQAFCARRNSSRGDSQARLVCRAEANVVEILESEGIGQPDGPAGARALLRFSYDRGVWRIYWWCDRGAWEPYPHLSEADSVLRVIDELEQAPLHVHWG
jgi:hypothetical protein